MAAYTIHTNTTNFATLTAFDTHTNTPSIHATTNINNLSSVTPQYTATFTAPNTTNAVTGVWLFVVADWGATVTLTATLYENNLATVCTKTVSGSNYRNNGWVYFRFATPYVFTSTTAEYYKFGFLSSSGGVDVAADGAGTAVAFIATDNRHPASIAATDDFWVGGCDGVTTTLTLSGTNSWGSSTDTTFKKNTRSIGYALQVGAGGIVQEDITTINTTTIAGIAGVNPYGEWYRGTTSTPMGAVTSTLTFSMTAPRQGGYFVADYGKLIFQGAAKTYYKTKYASGNGTTATPMVTANTTGWAVNDELRILATSDSTINYLETESKFIKTISGTSITLSDTAGGAESGLAYTHTTDAWILNITRNVITQTNNEAYFGWFYHAAQSTTGYVDIDWASYRYGNGNGPYMGSRTSIDNSTSGYGAAYNFYFQSSVAQTFSNNISHNSGNGSVTESGSAVISNKNITLDSCFFIQGYYSTLNIQDSYNCTFNDCVICSSGLNSASAQGMSIRSSNNVAFNRLWINATRGATSTYGAISPSGTVSVVFNNCEFGTKGAIKYFLNCATSTYNNLLFNDCNWGTPTSLVNTNTPLDGTEIKFHKYNGVTNKHFWYTPYGIAYATGTGLADTNVRTSGSLALKIEPTDTDDGFTWSFKILAKANSSVSCLGFIQKNAAFGTDDVTVELWLPGSTVADDTFPMPDDTSWNTFTVAANYTGVVDAYATVRINAKTVTSSAYIYIDDIYNGTNKITALDVWDEALPSPIMFEQLGDANAVWAVLTSTQTTAGTMGEKLAKQPFLVDDSGYIVKT